MFHDRLRFFSSKNLRWQRGFAYLMAVVIILLLPTASLAASQVTLAWNANSEGSLAGYRIYYKSGSSGKPYNGSGVTQGTSPVEIPLSSLADSSNPEVTLTGLAEGTNYYFAATAYDTYGNESGFSNEVVLEAAPPPSPVVHQVSASVNGNGTISPAGTAAVDDGDDLTYTFTAATHHHISSVAVDGNNIGAVSSYTFSNITADHTIAVSFAPDSYTISASAGANGSISPSGTTTVAYGQSQTYLFTPDPGYHIATVIVDGQAVDAGSGYQFSNVSADHTITVQFGIGTYTIAASAGANGTISPKGSITIAHGADQTYTISAAANYHVADVLVDGASVGPLTSYTFTAVIANHTIEASFAKDQYVVSAQAEANGTITPSGEISVECGTSVTLKLTPDTGYRVADVIIDGQSMGAMQTCTLDNVTANHTITARFEITDSSEPVMEFGDLEIDRNWTRVLFKEQFIDPVVVAGPLSFNGDQPAVVRINNVDATGFDIRIQEWPYLDGSHATESVSYLVMERGSYLLADGTRLEASRFTKAGTYSEQSVLFEQSYNKIPVVVSSVVSFNGTDAVVARMSNIDTEGFEFRLQTQEADRPTAPAAETIAYIACEPTSGTLDGLAYEIATSGDVVTDAFKTLTFTTDSGQAPAFIADMQSFNGGDTAGIRWQNKDAASVQVQIDEEQSANEEVRHVAENVGYILLSRVTVEPDSDNDGLTDADEAVYGTDPQKADSDNDGLDDAAELAYWGEHWNADVDNDGLINLLDEDADNDGISDGEEIDSGSDPGVFNINPQLPRVEVGQVQIDHQWTRVTLANTFQHPIVVAGPLSHAGSDPSVVRIRNVDASGFDIRVQEWDYRDGKHVVETVGYLVIDQGQYQLSDGTRLEAAVFQTSATGTPQQVSFSQACSVTPVVMTTITSFNEADAVTGRIQSVTPQGFAYFMQEQEANEQVHAAETVAYVACEPAAGSVENTRFMVVRTADEVADAYVNIMFPEPFAAAPVFLADMQTANGGDPSNIRQNNLDGFAVDIMIDEEQSSDWEDSHAAEVVGYMVFGQ